MAARNVKVRLEQKEGPLTLTLFSGEIVEYTVENHIVSAPPEHAQILVERVSATYVNEKDEPETP